MNFRPSKKGRGLIINITSLIDVMFLLLIFFMVTSTFKNQPAINLVLPRSATASETVDTPAILFLTAEDTAGSAGSRDPSTGARVEAAEQGLGVFEHTGEGLVAQGVAVGAPGEGLQGAALGVEGAMVQMISHGLISGAMFLCVGVLYDRMHSRQIPDYGGVANTMPVFAAFMVLFAMANAGLPGTSGFVGEFIVIIASFKASFWIAFFAATTLILGAAYTLWMVKRVVYGEIGNERVAALEDLNRREFFVLGIFALLVLGLGVWPAPLVDMMNTSIEQLIQQISQSKL